MNSNKYKLLIYIPTYNRAQSILRQLVLISNNIDKSKVMILLNDNDSN